MRLRRMLAQDLEYGLELSALAGWNQCAADWQLYLGLAKERAYVAEEDGQVIGTVIAVDYGGLASWIGMVLVNPRHRRRGAGTQLLQAALDSLLTCETVKLDATPAGRQVYLPLGFQDEYGLQRLERAGERGVAEPVPSTASFEVEPLSSADLSEVLALDREVFGVDRSAVLAHYVAHASEYAQRITEAGRLAGYSLGRNGLRFDQIGPVVARSPSAARALVHAVIRRHPSKPFLMDTMLHDGEWVAWLKQIGFQTQRPYTRMYRGPNRYPGRPREQYAILGPELG